MRSILARCTTPLALVLLAAPGTAADERPNVLFLLSDDQRPDAVAALGNPDVRTPSLDRLAREGLAFTNAYCMGSLHGAVCMPSREMIYSGRTLFRVPQGGFREEQPLPLLGEVFRAAGYATFFCGKWHAPRAWFQRSFEDGDAIFFGGMGSHTELPVNHYDPEGEYPNEARYPLPAFSSTTFADAAIGFLERHDGARPFFLNVSFTAPHDPRTPPEEVAALYEPGELPLPANFLPLHPFDNGELEVRDERLAPWPRTPEVVREHLADYYAMVTQLDRQVGRILAALEERGFAEETVVVFASDHGLAVGSHGLLGKQSLYEHSMGTPVLITGPGVPAGARSDAFVYLFDLYPTLCGLAGIEVPETVEGVSLLPALRGEPFAPRDSVFTAYADAQRAVRGERWKLIRYPRVDRTQLFDLAEDPFETTDLAADPERAALVAELLERLAAWQRGLGDPHPLTVADPEPAEWDWREHAPGGPARPGQAVSPSASGRIVLLPETARVVGEKLRYQRNRNNLGAWQVAGDHAEWRLVELTAGEYEVRLRYGADGAGKAFRVEAGEKVLEARTESTGGLRRYRTCTLGRLALPAGEALLRVQPAAPYEGALMNLRRVELTPVE